MADRATLRRTAEDRRGSQGKPARAAEEEERTQPPEGHATTVRKLGIMPATVLNPKLKNNDSITINIKGQGRGGQRPTGGWRQRGQVMNSTQGNGKRELFPFMLDNIGPETTTTTTTTRATTTPTAKATTAARLSPPLGPWCSWPAYFVDPSRCAAPHPRTGTAEGSHRGDCREAAPVGGSACRSQEQLPVEPTPTHEPGPGER